MIGLTLLKNDSVAISLIIRSSWGGADKARKIFSRNELGR